MTVLEIIRSAAEYLGRHGVENPRLHAEHLLARCIEVKRLELYLLFDRPVSEKEREKLREMVRRRARGEPLQHILGEWDFCGRTFIVDHRALVPRPETELLVERVRELLGAEHKSSQEHETQNSTPNPEPSGQPPPAQAPARPSVAASETGKTAPLAVDVGTGSGVLAISLALEWPEWRVAATDISPEALTLARENAAKHGVGNRIQWFECDVLPEDDSLQGAKLIVSNPPYIASAEIPQLPREVQHDPRLALDGGADGLAVIEKLIRRAATCLETGGWLLMEIGHGQAGRVLAMLNNGPWRQAHVRPDYAGIPRVVEAIRAG